MQKRILSHFSLFAIVGLVAAGVFMSVQPAPASAQGSGVFCDPPRQNTEVPIETGVTKEAYCKGLDAGNNPVCADGTIIPLDAGITAEDFCRGEHGGLANPATGLPAGGINTGGSSGGANCSFSQGGSLKDCGFDSTAVNNPRVSGVDTCGDSSNSVELGFDIGCDGKGNAIVDMTLAIMRFLTTGIGIIVVGSVIVGGIQYSASRGNPQATQAAIKRMQAAVGALILYIFAYAFINYVIPGAILK